FQDYSNPNLEAFRDWLKKKYKNDRRFQAAWGNDELTFKTAMFPDPVARDAAVWGSFRDPVAHRPAMDMERFQSELVVDTITYFAKVAKKATRNNSLVGVFYGYTMELNNNGPRSLSHSGHLAFGELLDVPEIDMIHAPYSYFERAPGQPGHMHLPLDSAALHNKLAVIEEDSYTHLGQAAPAENLIAPGWNARTASMDETLAVNLRNAGSFLSHRAGMWYFDLLSDGRWNAPVIWDTSVLLRRVAAEVRSEPLFSPEIAFVVDEAAVQYVRDNSHPYLIHALSWWRAELNRIGAPVGYYLMSDLARLPDSVKVIILPNAFALSDDAREYLARFMDSGGSVVWTYAPDIMGADGPDPARIGELTGAAVEAVFDNVPTVIVSDVSEETMHIDETSWRPRFIVTGGQGVSLGHYQETGEISAIALDFGEGKSIYTATPRLPVGVLRWIVEDAGAHIYRETPGMAARAGNYLFVHGEDTAIDTFHWPRPVRKVSQVYPPGGDLTVEEGRSWNAAVTAKSTVVFHIQPIPEKPAGTAGNFN
ncbi:MAG: beta-galactosidase, partial [Candidatus Hydrogenedentes bacterium]|nr:beta-galactosidase [Candidatus Hydrogenedentota bacterium]